MIISKGSATKSLSNFLGRFDLLRTIIIGTCVSIQGIYVRTFPDGRIAVRDGQTIYSGMPVA
ncbi:hypothetical protein C1J05_20415 [Sulfitobacter sp. JL08]|nr:hypothetical protein C1J05_20415 [Sulfitobacter sp. JL08]